MIKLKWNEVELKSKLITKDKIWHKSKMPKIQQIKSHNDTSLQIDNIPPRDFSQFGNQSFSRTAKKSMHESVVPIHEVSYDP